MRTQSRSAYLHFVPPTIQYTEAPHARNKARRHSSSSWSPCSQTVPQQLRVPIRTRHQPGPNSPPNRLRHPPLIHRPQAGLTPMFDPPHLTHILAHHREILVMLPRVHPQAIQHIRAVAHHARLPAHLPPFAHFGAAEIVRGVDVAEFVAAWDLLLQVAAAVGAG